MTNKVSVIIPYYNRYNTIRRAVESVLSSDNLDFIGELIIVDDGSKEQEALMLNAYISNLKHHYNSVNFKIVRYEKNRNAAYARNIGISNSVFDIIAFLDSDDEWVDGKLRKQIDYIESDTIVFTQYSKVHPSESRKVSSFPIDFEEENISDYLLLGHGHIQTSTLLMSKKTAEKVLFNPDLMKYQDWDFAIRAFNLGMKFVFIPQALTRYYLDADDRIGNKVNKKLVDDFILSIGDGLDIKTKNIFLTSTSLWIKIADHLYFSAVKELFSLSTVHLLGAKRIASVFTYLLKVLILRAIKRT